MAATSARQTRSTKSERWQTAGTTRRNPSATDDERIALDDYKAAAVSNKGERNAWPRKYSIAAGEGEYAIRNDSGNEYIFSTNQFAGSSPDLKRSNHRAAERQKRIWPSRGALRQQDLAKLDNESCRNRNIL
jgi:hypothetical protein